MTAAMIVVGVFLILLTLASAVGRLLGRRAEDYPPPPPGRWNW